LRRQQPRALAAFAPGIYPAAWNEVKRYHEEGGVVVTFDRKLSYDWDQVLFNRADNLYRAARHLLNWAIATSVSANMVRPSQPSEWSVFGALCKSSELK
jgi:hypothetical protein